MMILSLRKNFDSRFFFGPPTLRVRDGGARLPWSVAGPALRAMCRGRRVLVLIHGYNSSVDDALDSYRIIEKNLRQCGLLGNGARYSLALGLLWPGRTAPGYGFAERAAEKAGKLLAAILRDLGTAVSIETHSLGAKVALDAILQDAAPRVEDLILTAPAVDNESIQRGEKYGPAMVKCEGALVAYSRHDGVLAGPYRWFGSVWRNGLGGDDGLGCTGPEDPCQIEPWVLPLDGSAYVHDHSAWRSAPEFYRSWSDWLRGRGIVLTGAGVTSSA